MGWKLSTIQRLCTLHIDIFCLREAYNLFFQEHGNTQSGIKLESCQNPIHCFNLFYLLWFVLLISIHLTNMDILLKTKVVPKSLGVGNTILEHILGFQYKTYEIFCCLSLVGYICIYIMHATIGSWDACNMPSILCNWLLWTKSFVGFKQMILSCSQVTTLCSLVLYYIMQRKFANSYQRGTLTKIEGRATSTLHAWSHFPFLKWYHSLPNCEFDPDFATFLNIYTF